MAISTALSSALSGLLVSQKALEVVSNNLANINTPDYSVKVVNQEDLVLAGAGAGVQIGSITRSVDESLNTTLRNASSLLNQLQTTDTYNTQLQSLFGQPGDADSLSTQLQDLADALQSQTATGGQAPSASVQAASLVTGTLQSLSDSIQSLRTQADQQISQDVGTVNTTLQNIATLNNQIAVNAVAGVSTGDLEDQRDAALDTLSTYMNYVSFNRPDGTIALYTAQGTPLLETQPETLVHAAAASVQPQMAYSAAGESPLQGITVNGTDITSQITTGQIASLLQLRDGSLPNLQSQLDTLAQTLQTSLNQASNAGTSYPNGGQSLTGTTIFTQPSQQMMSLSGGDTDILLLNGDGTEQARTTVSTLMSSYLQANGLPTTNQYSVTQLATALNGWLNTQYSTTGMTYASVTPAGQFSIQLPQTSSTTIAFCDQQTAGYESTITSDNLTSAAGGQSLGLSGPLTFRDSQGNVYSYTVKTSDSLQDIANGLNALGGLTATLVPDGSNYQLQVTNVAGNDMTLDPDAGGNNAVSGLGLNASRSQPSTTVTVNYDSDQQGTLFTSSSYPSASSACGASGELTFRDKTGVLAQCPVSPTDTLSTVVANINAAASAGGNKIHAALTTVGNQVALTVTDLAGNQMSIDGSPSGYQSAPAAVAPTAAFAAAAGTLSITDNGTTYGPLTINPGDSLQTIADNLTSQVAGSGILASVQTDGTNSWLDIASTDGQPLTFSGSALGAAAGYLDINPDARDALGLSPAPDQTASGFADFLGLNDFLVSNQPQTIVDSQTLTTGFTTTGATNLELSDATWRDGDPTTGDPQSLNISLAAGQSLAQIAAQINSQAVTYDGNHEPLGTFSSAGGTLAVSSNLTQLSSVTIPAGATLDQTAQAINADPTLSSLGVRAMVATDGTNEWLRVYDQQGIPLTFAGSALGTQAGQLAMGSNQMVTASVIRDGAGQRLRISPAEDTNLQVTGTLSSQLNLGPSAVGLTQTLAVRSDIAANPSLLSQGDIQYDPDQDQFYAGATDTSALQAMSNAITTATAMPSAGGLGQASYSLTAYAANVIGSASTATSNNRTQMNYQQTLVNNLTEQQGSISGVNLDQELSDLITYQQSYQASAKVISTIQTLFDVLDSLLH
jgi:flagellar hook-associated protein 1 FlgK